MNTSDLCRRLFLTLIPLIALTACGEKQLFSEASCSVDSLNGSGELLVPAKGNTVLQVAGWALDSLSKKAPDSITINFVSSAGVVSKFAEGKLTVARPDVSGALHVPSVINAGFGLSAQLQPQASDIYEVQILQHFSDRILVCKSTKSIIIQ